MTATGFHDRHGIPIHLGDLIRVNHYRHYRNRRQMWLYFRVAKHPQGGPEFVVQNWHDLDATKWQCLLESVGLENAEVLAEADFSQTHHETFNERPRKKKNS